MSTALEDPPPESTDLGLGSRVAQGARLRLLNRDGSFNVRRVGLPFYRSLNPYHALVTISWPRFYGIIVTLYAVTNLLFASAYLACGPGALQGVEPLNDTERFTNAFFFSVQTLATIGYGRISPVGFGANALVALEAIIGLMGFALATGLAFARFSQPHAKILFSRNAVIAPYRGFTGFMFRIANQREKQLVDVHAEIVLARREERDGSVSRQFHQLPLERESVMLFPAHWVIVHPIAKSSPLFGVTREQLVASEAEFLVLLRGYDETSTMTVHSRTSYRADEVVMGARFVDMFVQGANVMSVDLRRIHDVEPVDLPGPRALESPSRAT